MINKRWLVAFTLALVTAGAIAWLEEEDPDTLVCSARPLSLVEGFDDSARLWFRELVVVDPTPAPPPRRQRTARRSARAPRLPPPQVLATPAVAATPPASDGPVRASAGVAAPDPSQKMTIIDPP